MDRYILVLVTTGSPEEGERIGKGLVEAGLAACCNILPEVRSIFQWKGEVCSEKEVLLLIKSKESLFNKLKESVKGLHSYEVPEIIAFPISLGSADYFKWMDEVIKA